MLHHRKESDEHLVRRLESFSDIVIGFSLAELTLNLAVPPTFSSLFSNATWLIAYCWTFTVVSYLWIEHHRLFARAFVPTKLAIVLNFVWLATIGLLVYLVQLYAHFFVNLAATRAIYMAYFGLFGLNLAITATLYGLAVRHPAALNESARTVASHALWRFGIAAGVVLTAVAAGPFMPLWLFWWMVGPSVGYGFFVAGFALRLWDRRTRYDRAV